MHSSLWRREFHLESRFPARLPPLTPTLPLHVSPLRITELGSRPSGDIRHSRFLSGSIQLKTILAPVSAWHWHRRQSNAWMDASVSKPRPATEAVSGSSFPSRLPNMRKQAERSAAATRPWPFPDFQTGGLDYFSDRCFGFVSNFVLGI